MKKIISLVLAVLMITSSLVFSASAASIKTDYPTIYFRGNSETIFDEDGNQVYDFEFDSSVLPDMCKNILPVLAKSYVTGDFKEYGEVFGKELDKIYDRCQLDENGNPKYGSGISEAEKNNNYNRMHTNVGGNDGFQYDYYLFANDWRLDPLKTADDIDVYIDNVLAVTGKDKVNLMCKCLGGDLILAYLAKYGTSKINGVGFGSTVAFGGTIVDDVFAGDIVLDPETIERFSQDRFLQELLPADFSIPFNFIGETVALAKATGVLGFGTNAIDQAFLKKAGKELIPHIVLSSYGTWPGYWAMVSPEKYASTKTFIFGKKGSERYEQYKGLIEKLDNYDKAVRQRIPEILTEAKANGVKIAIVSKYGAQMPPIFKTADEQGDVWTTVRLSSLGATVSKTATTFSKEYIAERTAQGLGKYLSPDNMVDASTCLFPDNTWFMKGALHNDWTHEEDRILTYSFNAENPTVNSFEQYPQFLVYDKKTDTCSPMTKYNCNTENFDVEKPQENTLLVFLRWLRTAFKLLIEKFKSMGK